MENSRLKPAAGEILDSLGARLSIDQNQLVLNEVAAERRQHQQQKRNGDRRDHFDADLLEQPR